MSSETKVAEIDRPIEELGTISFTHSENSVEGCECDRLVYSNNILLAVSFVSSPTQVKAVRAILAHKKGRVTIRTDGISAQYPSRTNETYYPRFTNIGLTPDPEGYGLWLHKLEYGKIHATFISKNKNLIMYVSPDSVWARLNDSEHFETPLLRQWMPYVAAKLVESSYLRECRCYRANAAVLDIKKREYLDDIVLTGLKAGKIVIP